MEKNSRLYRSEFPRLITRNVMIKYLNIAHYYEHNTFHPLYYRYIDLLKSNNETPKTKTHRFESLIHSFERRRRFNKKYPIYIDSNYKVLEGHQRVACSLYFNIPFLYYKIVDPYAYDYYKMDNLNIMLNHMLDTDELLEIEKTKEEILYGITQYKPQLR